jgi:hypothetical protein
MALFVAPQTSYASMIWFRFKGCFSARGHPRTPLSDDAKGKSRSGNVNRVYVFVA